MAKSIYICSRKTLSDSVESQLYEICKKLAPDNIISAEPAIVVNRDIAYAVMNPNSSLTMSGNNLLMGQIFDKDENWSVPLHEFPDGSFALFRDGNEHCEIVSDPAASRTIWYYLDENLFIASTSQRAIIMFIGSFEFDEKVIPWMLSTGTLGPTLSWDKRIKRIPPDSSIILNKNTWTISTKSIPIEFNLIKRTDEQHEKLLFEAIRNTIKSLNLDYSVWTLPLSGGGDSRGILCFLHDINKDFQDLKTITWGLKSSLIVKGNDAYVAKELANQLNVSHKYYHTDLSKEPIDKIIDRFVLLGEGRIDHLAAYMDGFEIWKTLFEGGIQGTIRGDQAFGSMSTSAVTSSVNCGLCSDFSNLKDYKKYGFALQELPLHLYQKKGETSNGWRNRLLQQYRLPTMLAALSDLKFSYIEQISPLLSRTILQPVRQLPEHLLAKKVLWKKIVGSLSPEVEYASSLAEAQPWDLLRMNKMVSLLKNELSSDDAKTVFPSEFLNIILKEIQSEDQSNIIRTTPFTLKSTIKKFTPHFIKKAIRKVLLPIVDYNILAFRVLLITKMNKILNEDCQNN